MRCTTLLLSLFIFITASSASAVPDSLRNLSTDAAVFLNDHDAGQSSRKSEDCRQYTFSLEGIATFRAY
ncbi:MAG: hypothetical protein IH599_00480, partial [Bacteroidales bacterium]|nr:hypothetical protein [Bacteroidales bacterium]